MDTNLHQAYGGSLAFGGWRTLQAELCGFMLNVNVSWAAMTSTDF